MTLPVSLKEAKAQLRVDGDDQNAEIEGFIQDAAGWGGHYTGHILEARDVTEQFRGFGPVSLRAWPIAPGASPSGAYLDSAGVPLALVGPRLDLTRRPARVLPPVGSAFWPFYNSNQLFTVTIRAGYESPADVPRDFRRAMLVLISAYDADCEGGSILAQAQETAARLCRGYKVHRV